MARRSLMRYFGAKIILAPQIVSHFPPHRSYTEVFGGSLAVLLAKPPASIEVVNDLNLDVVTLYRVIRDDDKFAALMMRLLWTPFSRVEFEESMIPCPPGTPDLERAHKFVVRHSMGYGLAAGTGVGGTGFRAYSGSARSAPALDWSTYTDSIARIAPRIRRAIVEHGEACDVLRRHDHGGDVLHYLDPPYVPETRADPTRGYAHEMTVADHERLLDCLLSLKGMVVLSGYASALYDDALRGRVTLQARDQGGRDREEVLWLSPSVVAARAPAQGRLL